MKQKILFHDRDLCHIETSQLICRANQRTGFYLIGTSAMNESMENNSDNVNSEENNNYEIIYNRVMHSYQACSKLSIKTADKYAGCG